MNAIDELKKLRRKFRREATRLRKYHDRHIGTNHGDRCWYEHNVYNSCAHDIDKVIKRLEADD